MKRAINWLYLKFMPDHETFIEQKPDITDCPPSIEECQEMVMLEWHSANWIERMYFG